MTARRHDPVFPGFKEMAARRERMVDDLVTRRLELGLSQTEVAARMGRAVGAVRMLWLRALSCLRRELGQAGTSHDPPQ